VKLSEMIETAPQPPCTFTALAQAGGGAPAAEQRKNWSRIGMSDAPDTTNADGEAHAYVDTPYGIMTAAGRWYHIPEADVREYAGAVLDHVSLDRLVQWADAWVDSPRTATLWLLPVLLWTMPAGWAVGSAAVFYLGWALVSPALPSVGAVRAASGLGHTLVQGVYYAVTLSTLAAVEQYAAVGTGLAAFVLFRWGIVGWVFGAVLRPLRRRLYPLPVTDQVLRGLIVRAALKYRVSVPQVDAITSDILDNWGAHADDDSPPSSSTQ